MDVFLTLLLFLCSQECRAKVLKASIRTVLKTYSDIYLGSFTFDKTGGKIIVQTDAGVNGQRLLFFDDNIESWPVVLKTYEDLSCIGLRNVSLLLTQGALDKSMSEGLSIPRGSYEAELQLSPTQTPEPWYLMISNCDDVINVDLTITLLNVGNWWYQQFTVDEQGLLPMFFFFTIYYIVGFIVFIYVRGLAFLRLTASSLDWLYMVALVLEFLSVFLQTLHGAQYASDGIGLIAMQGLAELADAASNCCIMTLLIFLAMGLSPVACDQCPRTWLMNAGIFVGGFLSLLAFDRFGRTLDQRFCYDSDVGALLIVYRLAAFGFFSIVLSRSEGRVSSARSIADIDSVKEQDGKHLWSRHVLRWGATMWFTGLPAAYFIAQLLARWEQMRIILGVSVTLHAVALLVLGGTMAAGTSLVLGSSLAPAQLWRASATNTPYDEI